MTYRYTDQLRRSKDIQTTISAFSDRNSASQTKAKYRVCTDGGATSLPEEEPDLSLTPSVREFIRAARGHGCELCDAGSDDSELHIHHRIPKSEGGSDHPENLILLCKDCHQRHHGNLPVENRIENKSTDSESHVSSDEAASSNITGESTSSNTSEKTQKGSEADDNTEPLPPRSEPNGADQEIIDLIEERAALSTRELAEFTDYSEPYIRRQCWKLAGEQLIVPTENNNWELMDRISKADIEIGLPDTPKAAARAGRDEVIRQMAAHGISHTEIAEITNLSRSTVEVAVDRARALRLDLDSSDDVDLTAIATRLSAILSLIDRSRSD